MNFARFVFFAAFQMILMTACSGGSGSAPTLAIPGPSIYSFVANPTRIAKGDSASLVCTFTGTKGIVSPTNQSLTANGSVLVSPTDTTTYTLEVVGQNGQTTSKAVTLEVFDSPSERVGPMLQARYRHTATLLNSGLILIAGGQDNFNAPLATAELYNPATKTFRTTGSMASARFGHTATLLDDGRVLIVGQDLNHYGEVGTLGNGPASEIYDPSTEQFSKPAMDPIGIRFDHTATKMKDGRVFITKGVRDLGSSIAMSFTYEWKTTSEIFNPHTGHWSMVSADTSRISAHGNAALLENGLILNCGGMEVSSPSDTAELYNPITNTSSILPTRLTEGRMTEAIATLPGGKLILAGGTGTNGALSSTDIFDPTTMSFTRGPVLPLAWSAPIAAPLANGTVLFFQAHGKDSSNITRANTAMWSATDGITEWNSTREDREQACAVRLQNGTILISGGKRDGKALATAEEIYK